MTDIDNLCMNCMSDMEGKQICPVCGHRREEPQKNGVLGYRTSLQNRYLTGRVKSANGEGMVYIGYDTVLNIPVELHEFFPRPLSERDADGKEIHVLGGSEPVFEECKANFLSYARELAHMRELSFIQHIYDIFEENGTAYTVSEWDDSIPLRYFVERSGGNLGWNTARQLFMPVLSSLSALHEHSVCHLGISPETLQIMKDGKMKLSGFSIREVRQMDTDLPPDLIPGCAAIEQYIMGDTLGEGTDVYGFAASLFFALTGSLPPEAPKRRTDARLMIPNSLMRSLPPYVVSALANALQVSPEKRTPTFERLRAELSAAPTVTAAIEASQRFDRISAPAAEKSAPRKKSGKRVPDFVWVASSCLVMLAILMGIGVLWMNQNGAASQNMAALTAASGSASSSAESQAASAAPSGADQIPVPDLVGQNYNQLVSQQSSQNEENQDYQILLSSQQFSDTVSEGLIISQDPKPGASMTRGTAIVVVVSEGAAVRTQPEIAGKAQSDASSAVTSAGFVPAQAQEYSDTVPEGQVIGYQDNVKAGSQMAYGSRVIIVVSSGPNPSPDSSSPSSDGMASQGG